MKRFVLILGLLLPLLFSRALATELEVTYWDVNFRSSPGGAVIGRFDGGEILEGLGETWANDRLWYHARSDKYGEGYISALYAVPVWNGRRCFAPAGEPEPDHLTDNMLAFRREWYEYLFTHGYISWTGDVPDFHDPGDYDSEDVIALARTLLKHGMLVENGQTAILRDDGLPNREILAAASAVLKAHYGTDDVWRIVYGHFNAVGSPSADWHNPQYPTGSDQQREDRVFREVSEKYRAAEESPRSAGVSPETVLYYNPDGGTKYHTDMNCPSTNPKYLPFSGHFTWAEVHDAPYAELRPCNVCGAPQR